jgi:hypothetical protein
MDGFESDTILFLVSGITMIAITLAFGFALTVEQIRTNAKKPQAARQQTSDRLAEKEEADVT